MPTTNSTRFIRLAESRQLEREAHDYAYDVLAGVLLGLLLWAMVAGHAWISASYG